MGSSFDLACSLVLQELYKEIGGSNIQPSNLSAFDQTKQLMWEAVQVQNSNGEVFFISDKAPIDLHDIRLRCLVDLVSLYIAQEYPTMLKVGNNISRENWEYMVDLIKSGDTVEGPFSRFDELLQLTAGKKNATPSLERVIQYAKTAPIDWSIIWGRLFKNRSFDLYRKYEALVKLWRACKPYDPSILGLNQGNVYNNSDFPGKPKQLNTPVASFSVWSNRLNQTRHPWMSLSADPKIEQWLDERTMHSGKPSKD